MTQDSLEPCQDAGCVQDLMTPDPISVRATTSVADALRLMSERRIRHLPVADEDNRLLGIVSRRDITTLPGGAVSLEHVAVSEVMQSAVDTVTPHGCVASAARHMLRTKRSSLPVVDEKGNLVGILTEADFVRFALRGRAPCTCNALREAG